MPGAKDDLSDLIHLINDVRSRNLEDPQAIALRAEEIVEKLILEGKWEHAKELLEMIKLRMKLASSELPQEETIRNVFRHVLKVVREEYEAICKERPEFPPHHIFTAKLSDMLKYSESCSILKTNLLDHLAEYKEELEASTENIVSQGSDLIYANEVVLTIGKSNIVEKFLQRSGGKSPQIIVAEDAPTCCGHIMASNLAKSNLDTTVISDAAVFAIMSRVNKVVIGAQTVMGLTGLHASSGVHAMIQAANYYKVPVLVLAPTYKLSPLHHKKGTLEKFASPGSTLPQSAGASNKAKIINPLLDYIPLELVTMIITQQGGVDPSYISQLHSDLYHPDDYYI